MGGLYPKTWKFHTWNEQKQHNEKRATLNEKALALSVARCALRAI
jgi:hypothetical protein